MEYYLADYIENLYYHQLFVYAKPIWVVLIKNGLDLETFFLHNGFSNTPSNSIKFHQFHGTEQNTIFLFRLCVESYIPCDNFKSF